METETNVIIVEGIQSDVLSISDMLIIATRYGEPIDHELLNDQLHMIYLKLDSLKKKL